MISVLVANTSTNNCTFNPRSMGSNKRLEFWRLFILRLTHRRKTTEWLVWNYVSVSIGDTYVSVVFASQHNKKNKPDQCVGVVKLKNHHHFINI